LGIATPKRLLLPDKVAYPLSKRFTLVVDLDMFLKLSDVSKPNQKMLQ
jgi:hypothetical protein